MDEMTVRAQLAEVQDELKRNEEEHKVLASLLQGYEGWLRLRGLGKAPRSLVQTAKPPVVPAVKPKRKGRPGGTISFKDAVLTVLKEARGEPLHSRELIFRARGLGAITRARRPAGVVDVTMRALANEPIEKVAPRTWRWVGNGDGAS